MNDKVSRPLDLFSPTYAIARSKFLGAASARGLALASHVLDMPSAEGETLAMDVVLDGPADASKMLIVLSGVHGVEGFCGSAVQTGLLAEGAPAHADTAVLHVHAINPYGFSHLRRVTQENVDLNRNFVDFAKPLPVNAGYAEIHDWLLPITWPPGADAEAGLAAYAARHGARGLQRAISLGQYERADGMFFGGHAPTWSNLTFRSVLKRYTPKVRQLASVDIHTGLGPRGHGERIFASFDAAVLPRARQWWGELTDVHTGSSTSIPMTGPIQTALFEECPQAEQIGICLEYGTYPSDRIIPALRAEHWLHRRGTPDPLLARQIKRDLKEAFYPDADDWKHDIWRQGREACLQAIKGLQTDCPVEA
ncbi:M14 family metallopeptidase [Bradyrhizobium sp. McL0616]|uniref:M14 family metallopeptidase n=1 Tax=Bradyrhizobium sp. McL0616 TaxID=3415674 RepID=UPI003CF46DE7